jgi:hypothetical protein
VYATVREQRGDRLLTIAGRIENWEDARLIVDAVNGFDELRAFVRQIARLQKDGEQMPGGEEFDMPSDDAVETVNGLISQARRVLHHCPDCDSELTNPLGLTPGLPGGYCETCDRQVTEEEGG